MILCCKGSLLSPVPATQCIPSKQKNGSAWDCSWPDCAGILKSLLCYELEREGEAIVLNINLAITYSSTTQFSKQVWSEMW